MRSAEHGPGERRSTICVANCPHCEFSSSTSGSLGIYNRCAVKKFLSGKPLTTIVDFFFSHFYDSSIATYSTPPSTGLWDRTWRLFFFAQSEDAASRVETREHVFDTLFTRSSWSESGYLQAKTLCVGVGVQTFLNASDATPLPYGRANSRQRAY
ncbi:hypothetical protein KVT40_005325 [Elsinoe batatas]|uniref:Uncharacterized protein n=1 Tax=Elsinoe batatas TaxID=2601811 RepID=A0A8K0L2S7_9PEZI|nr:hypothetical protein KVT40_005325 [Elsinoe batatas]